MHPNPISFQRRMHPELAPTLMAALNPEAVDADSPGVRIARAMIEDACTAAVTDIHIEPYREGRTFDSEAMEAYGTPVI